MTRSLLPLPLALSFFLAGCMPDSTTPDCAPVGFVDGDGDGYGDPDAPVTACDGGTWAVNDGDCNDADAASFPGGSEVCDDADNDCDGVVDEDATDPSTWWPDADGDGYGDERGSSSLGCHAVAGSWASEGGDCDDADPDVSPGAAVVCGDDVDNNCDGLSDCELGFAGEIYADEASAVLTPATPGHAFGSALFGLGDVSGDGLPEVLVGPDAVPAAATLAYDVIGGQFGDDMVGTPEETGLWSVSATLEGAVSVPRTDTAGSDLFIGDALYSGSVCRISDYTAMGQWINHGACVYGIGESGSSLAMLPNFADASGPLVAVASPEASGDAGEYEGRVTFLDDTFTDDTSLAAYPNYITGDATRRQLGTGALAVGDLNGDGSSDLLIPGANRRFGGDLSLGVVYLVTQPILGAVSIDDAASAFMVSDAGDSLLGEAMVVADDLDGDGTNDLIVGDTGASAGGMVYLVSGASLAQQAGGARVGAVALSELYGVGAFGTAVGALDDLNGDGLSEVAVGAPDTSTTDPVTGLANRAGAAYVWNSPFAGRLSTNAARESGGPDFTVQGATDGAQFGAALLSPGDMDGRGGADLLIGAPGADAVFFFASDPL